MAGELFVSKARSREWWQELVKECESSGKSRREYCTERGIRYKRYRYWVGVFEREQTNIGSFQELVVTNTSLGRSPISESYEVELRNSLVVRIPGAFNPENLSRLVVTLSQL